MSYDLVQEVCEVLDRNGYDEFSNYSLSKVLGIWEENKKDLIELFRKHPNWNEEQKMIVTSLDFDRKIDTSVVRSFHCWLTDIIFNDFFERRDEILNCLNHILFSQDSVVSKEIAKYLNDFNPDLKIRCGQKVSRATNKFLTFLKINENSDYNKRFATYSDAVNPHKIKKHVCISLNPIDYLLMSNGNSWTTCHSIYREREEVGCYSGGTVSYMLDSHSFIVYTVSKDYKGEKFELQPKINRQVFAYGFGKLMQSKLYPSHTFSKVKILRDLVQKTISKCLQVNDIWEEVDYEKKYDFIETNSDSAHYADYDSSGYCNLSYIESAYSSTPMTIGHPQICVECGTSFSYGGSITCCSGNCSKCSDCGHLIADEDVYYVNGYEYCYDCVNYCDHCQEYTRDSVTEVEHMYVCESCINRYYFYCEECDEYARNTDKEEDAYGNEVCRSCLMYKYERCRYCDEFYYRTDVEECGSYYCCENCYPIIEEEVNQYNMSGRW